MDKQEVGFGIVGAGMIAPIHIEAIEATRHARFVAIADPIEERAAKLGAEHNARWYSDHRRMLQDREIDVVCVCTPSGMRGQVAVDAARAGKHVLVEKPLETTLQKADAVIKACDDAGVMLAAVMQCRFLKGNADLKSDIIANRLGKLVLGDAQVKWHRPQSYYDSSSWRGTWKLDGGGALMNQGIHYVDLLQWFMGPVEIVTAHTATLTRRIEVEDTAVAILKFANGALGTIAACTSTYPGTPARMEVRGERGTVIVESGQTIMRCIEGEPDSAASTAETVGGASDPSAIGMSGHQMQIADVVSAIRNGHPPMIDGREARKALEIILAIYESARIGGPVSLPLTSHTLAATEPS